MSADWIKSPTARRVLVHWADARPAWLWSQDGERLLWRNDAARFFHGKVKKHGLRLLPEAAPIKGQIARLIRLGSMGRSSLSRIQFLAGDRPTSTTCSCTPLELADGTPGLLIVGVDPIEHELLEAATAHTPDPLSLRIFPAGAELLLVSEDGQIAGGTPRALERFAPVIESEGLPDGLEAGSATLELPDGPVTLTRYTASPHDGMLLLFEGLETERASIDSVRNEDGLGEAEEAAPTPVETEPLLPLGLSPVLEAPANTPTDEDNWVEPEPKGDEEAGSLASLFDRLADDDGLYTALSPADEIFDGPPPAPVETPLVPAASEEVAVPATAEQPAQQAEAELHALPEAEAPPVVEAPAEPGTVSEAPAEPDAIGALIAEAEAETQAESSPEAPTTVWRVIGRGFEEEAEEEPVAPTPPDAETVERVSRYNFDELSRILTDRVSGPPEPHRPAEPVEPQPGEGSLINLAGETFILNRLPLGILVFRDQQVLFANRALTDLAGYESIDSLRQAGLTAIFPSEDAASAGPVTQLVRRDGVLVAVNARLQSITWHGRPALMLSASLAESRTGHEGAVRTFAELAANASEEGFIAADRAGIVTTVSLHARILLGRAEEEIVGKPLAVLVEPRGLGELKHFLDRPARFAETARPATVLAGAVPNTRLLLFAEGQAGIVAGYFGYVRKLAAAPQPASPARKADEIEPSMLTRISRGVRRPLNTVIGFAEMIRSTALGSIENQRYLEYAQDIKTAGEEIATLIDELDDFARLREGRYPAQADDIQLSELLEACLLRVRGQASEARVLVRSAVSEQLPRITADRASLTQAVLNLLASAIDQTPVGGSVILSAQREGDGAVVVNVRDGGEARTDLGERFVVFRDGVGKDGEVLQPVRSSVGLALTRSLLAVNALSLSVDPAVGVGTMFSLLIPAELVRE